jgi:hypothetical protein
MPGLSTSVLAIDKEKFRENQMNFHFSLWPAPRSSRFVNICSGAYTESYLIGDF